MQSNNKKKICIVVSSLGYGGAQKSAALQSLMLEKAGYSIHIVSVLNSVVYDYAGELFNLGLYKDKRDTLVGRVQRLLKFRKYLKQHNFDCIIDHRARVQGYRELLISKFIYNAPCIYVVHNYKTAQVFTKYNWLNRFIYKNEVMVAVSREAEVKFRKKFNLSQIQTIYNSFDFDGIQKQASEINSSLTASKYIIYFGRMLDAHKNLKLLLKAFKLSVLPQSNYKLLMLGTGTDLDMLKTYSKSLDLEASVIFKSFESNPFPFVKQAYFTVLSSRFEGFPMVILESLCVGTPVVSVNCKSGPKEIITHEHNGLLVENNNAEALAKAMSRMLTDKALYAQCTANAVESIEKFSMQKIATDWKHLIEDIT